MGLGRRMAVHKHHDEVFQELCKQFPGLVEYLLDGHIVEVGKLTEFVRGLNNALASADARYDDRHSEANFLTSVNKNYADIIRRVGMMLDFESIEQLEDEKDMVSCDLPVSVALDLAKAAKPLIIQRGEEELEGKPGRRPNANGDTFDPSIFALHQNGRVSDQTTLKMFMGIDPALVAAESVVAPSPSAPDVQPGTYVDIVPMNISARSTPSLVDELKTLADSLLRRDGWYCQDFLVYMRPGTLDVEIKAYASKGARSVDAEKFKAELRYVAKDYLPATVRIDEVTVKDVMTGNGPFLVPVMSTPTVVYEGRF